MSMNEGIRSLVSCVDEKEKLNTLSVCTVCEQCTVWRRGNRAIKCLD